jgi:phosphatidylglycerol:prolipoprotein diacylglycerol transferase
MMLDALLAAATPPAPATGIQFPTIDPIAVSIGPFAIRWYALAYIAGLMLGWRYIVRLTRTPRLWAGDKPGVTSEQGDDFLFWATLGVILGGRIGYVLFYMLPDAVSREALAAEPWKIVAIWEGGMSFHGGLLGVGLAIYLFARRNNINLLSLADVAAAATPIGLFFGRLANFVNGELWGRPTDAPWGVVFPGAGPEPRHPSQLYEAALEGLVLFAILRVATHRYGALKTPGMTAGLFLIGYGVFRALVELVREPDRQMPEALRGFVTMGMLLCIPMIVAGAYLVMRARRGDGGGATAARTA